MKALKAFFARIKKLSPEFGLLLALRLTVNSFLHRGKRNIVIIRKYLTEHYSDVLEKYRLLEREQAANPTAEKNVWALWLTGYDTAPELIKKCGESLMKNAGDCRINLLDEEAALSLVSVPDYITEKYRKGIICPAHYSDVIRLRILRELGGIWADAKIFVSGEIDGAIFDLPFWSPHFEKDPESSAHYVADRRWICGLMGTGVKGSLLFSLVSELHERYWAEHDTAITYLLLDHFIDIAYLTLPSAKAAIDAAPLLPERHVYDLGKRLNDEYDEGEWNKLAGKEKFHILSRKKEISYEDGTYYSRVVKGKGEK